MSEQDNSVEAVSERLSQIELIEFEFSDKGRAVDISAPGGFELTARLEKHEAKNAYAWHFSPLNRIPDGAGPWVFDLRRQIHFALNG